MNARSFLLVAVAVSLLSGCASKRPSSQTVEPAKVNEESTGDESGFRYRKLEGSPGFSAEEADQQLEGY